MCVCSLFIYFFHLFVSISVLLYPLLSPSTIVFLHLRYSFRLTTFGFFLVLFFGFLCSCLFFFLIYCFFFHLSAMVEEVATFHFLIELYIRMSRNYFLAFLSSRIHVCTHTYTQPRATHARHAGSPYTRTRTRQRIFCSAFLRASATVYHVHSILLQKSAEHGSQSECRILYYCFVFVRTKCRVSYSSTICFQCILLLPVMPFSF
ncbi:unnamed protein product [Xylocopa violacea]|uniref:T. brucei spp.-specific protein n=1 Tax=Xylocopa violacea TaxID=135666 RepID=A0ABP1PIE3_XYLVO